MKKTILLALIALCNLLKASDVQLKLPIYDPFTKSTSLFPVDLDKKDPFTQHNFRNLIQMSCDREAFDYHITAFKSSGLSGMSEYTVADTHGFNHWITRGGKVDPVTRKLIISNSRQDFIIRSTKDGYQILRVYYQPTPAVLTTAGQKRTREDSLTNDDIQRAFRQVQFEKELRRAKEQAFLRDND